MKRQLTLKNLCLLIVLLFAGFKNVYAAVTAGTYTVGTGGTYATLADAVTDLNSSTISGPVIFDIIAGTYSGSNWMVTINSISGGSSTNTVTIKSQSGKGTVIINSPGTTFILNNASNLNIKDLTINNTSNYNVVRFTGTSSTDSITGCRLTAAGQISSSSYSYAIISASNTGSGFTGGNLVYINDTLVKGGLAYHAYGSGTSSLTQGHLFDGCQFLNQGYEWVYSYYAGGVKITNTEMTTNGSSFYAGFFMYYTGNGLEISNNNMTVSATTGSFYPMYLYYSNYYSGSSSTPIKISNNNYTFNCTGYGYLYGIYMPFNYYVDFSNNTFNCNNNYYGYFPYYLAYYWNAGSSVTNNTFNLTQTNSYYYTYFPYMLSYYASAGVSITGNTFNGNIPSYGTSYGMYYSYYSSAAIRNNTFNYNNPSGGAYFYVPYYPQMGGGTDSVENNTWNISTTSGYIYNYKFGMQGGPTSVFRKNTFNMTATTGSIYNYFYYMYGANFRENKLNMTTTSGTIYACYDYYYYSSTSTINYIAGNIFDARSTNGTIYAYYNQYPASALYTGNVFSASTAGSTYMLNPGSYCYSDVKFINNTFHSNSTGSTNSLVSVPSGVSGRGAYIIYNNVFSRSSDASGTAVYYGDTTYNKHDYNLYYSPGSVYSLQFQNGIPSVTTTSLQSWRQATKRDMNSLIYAPAYKDAASFDFRPDVTAPGVWAMCGRGLHFAGDTLDAAGTVTRPKTRQTGVPDLGAYEFTPTSIPPDADATPATPVANSTQTFTFGGDTVATIDWGSSVPASASMKQYSGQQAGAPMPGIVPRAYVWVNMNTGSNVVYNHTPNVYYKDPQLGNISSETNARIAKSSMGGIWEGYNFTNGVTDSVRNITSKATPLDSTGAYTVVENARIGIRCIQNPTGISIANITAYTADITWDPVFLPLAYEVIVDTNPGTPTSNVGANWPTTNAMQATNLNENTTYYVHIRSVCGIKDTSGWSIATFKTIITCHNPTVHVTALTQTRAIVYWDTVQTATKYEYAITYTPTAPLYGTTIYTNQVQVALEPGKDYYIWVKAYCNGMYPNSDWGTLNFSTFPTGISTIGGQSIGMEAYPNPVKEVLHISLHSAADGDAYITVTDVNGKQVRSEAVTSGNMDINMTGLPAGIYQVKYSDRSHVDVLKVNKQ
ncbi:MAG: hypothetical protein JST82_12425 [Bacteroidetes bacterium]|nr:hypothetical protein [Bacteroidota bacterium]